MSYTYSDLEVVSKRPLDLVFDSIPEVVPGNAPEAVPASAPEYVAGPKADGYEKLGTSKSGQRHICGLKSKIFWTLLGVSAILGSAGIAGGIAGGLQNRNKDIRNSLNETTKDSRPPGMSTRYTVLYPTSSTSATPTTSDDTVSTATIVLPTATLLRDCPSSNGTLYNVAYGSDEPLMFRKFCTSGFRKVLNSIDVVNEPRQSLNDCIKSCADYNDRHRAAITSGDNQTCNAVCWRSNEEMDNINQMPGQCFGYMALNNSAGFQITDEILCDSAGWINQRDL
jgi:hypothetical protein